ncbi:PAS domain-containing protein [Ferrovibrio sp.]|uniref:PAS domain-containing protein n=1 Tax=Ferrovibrio sp. TaxID=1917215 RepID=UPI00311EE067
MDFLASLPAPLTISSRRFLALWDGWRDGALLPRRHRLDTAALGDLLGHCLLLQIRGHDDMPIRFAGNTIRELLGAELAGTNYLDLTAPENRRRRADLLLTEVAQPCAAVIYYWLSFEQGGEMPVELVSAPMLADDGDMASLVVACATPLTGSGDSSIVERASYAEGDGLHFINIGAGLPPGVAAIGRPVGEMQ